VDRFDRQFWHRLWLLTKPYWVSARRRRALWLLFAVTALSLGAITMSAVFSYVSRDVMNALQARNSSQFYHLMLLYVAWIIIYVPMATYQPYLSGILGIEWRDWMTTDYVARSLRNHALYRVMRDRRVDNPDQRISEDLNSFTSGALNYSNAILSAVVTAATFFGILWSISHWLALCLILYALLGTWGAIIIGRRLVHINFDQQRYEADYRFALVHARNNAEAIALYQGEQQEAGHLGSRFSRVVSNFKLLLLWQRHLTLFTHTYNNAAGLVPYFVLAGAYFSGRYKLGEFTQAAFAFEMLQHSLSLVVNRFEGLTEYASVVNRLADFSEQCERAAAPIREGEEAIAVSEGDYLAAADLSVLTPDRSRLLQDRLSFRVNPGHSLLILGPSGAGKTTLMRVVAGLWRQGSGHIVRPALEQILFLPQQPYLVLGSLREQLRYPRAGQCDDRALLAVLAAVNLAELPARWGGLDAQADWAVVLSIGEQQRLAFARLLLNRPRWAFLDEATSALDLETEALLYSQLARLPTTVISIAHRTTLRRYHRECLQLRPVLSELSAKST